MPVISGGGGGGGAAFNGGTITNPLTINRAASTATALTVLGLHTDLQVDGFGELLLTGDESVNVNLTAAGAFNAAGISLADGDGNSAAVNSANGVSFLSAGTGFLFALSDGSFRFRYTSAPADGTLGAGDCALWLDTTNGACKLMVKAKQADGTVVTGSLALAP